MNIEVGKYYKLKNKHYFCVNLQIEAKFSETPICTKIEHTSVCGVVYGKLIKHEPYGDTISDIEIEFSENDILEEYELKEYDVPFFYMDFSNFVDLND